MDVEIMKRLTRAVRVADKRFMQTGGSTRHYVIECLVPCLEEDGLTVCVSNSRGEQCSVCGDNTTNEIPVCDRCRIATLGAELSNALQAIHAVCWERDKLQQQIYDDIYARNDVYEERIAALDGKLARQDATIRALRTKLMQADDDADALRRDHSAHHEEGR